MNKMLKISLIAVLAVVPLMARAADGDPVAGAPVALSATEQTADAVTAGTAPKYALAVQNSAKDGNVATAGYVKGAYNAAIKAINKVSEVAGGAIKSVTSGTETSGNGTIIVDGNAVSVYGLGTAAYTDADEYDAAGDADAAEAAAKQYADTNKVDKTDIATSIGTSETASDTKVASQKAVAAAIEGLTNSGATQAGVLATIDDASATYTPAGSVGSVTIDVMDEWGSEEPGSITVPGGTFTGTQATIDIVAPATYKTGN